MKYIKKGLEPLFLSQWKSHAAQHGIPVDYQNFKMDYPKKTNLHHMLIQEQGAICCYCEDEINSHNSHIEHFEPQSTGKKTLDYDNLLISCLKKLPPRYPLHCGHAKGNWFDAHLLISPLDPGCETRFAYSAFGDIRPSNSQDTAAITTIDKLQLNSPILQAKRKAAIISFLDPTLTHDDLRKFVNGYLKQKSDGSINRFYTTIHHIFSEYLNP